MSNKQLSTSLSPPAQTNADRVFLTVEQEDYEDETVTAEEAADTVDNLYDTSICDESYELPVCGGKLTVNPPPEDPDEEEINEAGDELGIPSCAYLEGYNTIIRIYRSDQTKQYKLVLESPAGVKKIQGPLIKTETRTFELELDGQEVYELQHPIITGFTSRWSGEILNSDKEVITAPDIEVVGNDLVFSEGVTATLFVTYGTIYESYDLRIDLDEDGNFEETTKYGFLIEEDEDEEIYLPDIEVLVFYEKTVTQFTAVAPTIDNSLSLEELKRVCLDVTGEGETGTVEVPGENNECFTLIRYEIRCECSKKLVDVRDVRKNVVCPDGVPGGQIGTPEPIPVFVDCQEIDEEIASRDFYKEVCCESAPGDWTLPRCKKVFSVYTADGISPELKQTIIDRYGDDAQIDLITPNEGFCGEQVVEQVVDRRNCCDGVSRLLYNQGESSQYVGQSSSAEVACHGGKLPITWSIRGQGFWLDASRTKREIEAGRNIRVYTDETACGTGKITIDDGCTVDFGTILSTAGYWMLIDSWVDTDFFDQGIPPPRMGGDESVIDSGTTSYTVEILNEEFRLLEYTERKSIRTEGSACTGSNASVYCDRAINDKDSRIVDPSHNYNIYLYGCYDLSRCNSGYDEGGGCTTALCSTYCYDCGSNIHYRFVGQGVWASFAKNLHRAELYRWVC